MIFYIINILRESTEYFRKFFKGIKMKIKKLGVIGAAFIMLGKCLYC